MANRYKEFVLLPEKDNFSRLKGCDFNLINDTNLEKTKIATTLKKNYNPILILFYYNVTPEKILSEFFIASLEKNLEKGEEKDSILDGSKEEKLDFKFGFVNLDLEGKVLETFQELKGLNPFVWTRIEKDAAGDYTSKPFILFYYHTIPQIMYEGVVDGITIRGEFSKWRKELVEIENNEFKEVKKKIVSREGYYECLENDLPVTGMVKGRHYYVHATPLGNGIFNYVFNEV